MGQSLEHHLEAVFRACEIACVRGAREPGIMPAEPTVEQILRAIFLVTVSPVSEAARPNPLTRCSPDRAGSDHVSSGSMCARKAWKGHSLHQGCKSPLHNSASA